MADYLEVDDQIRGQEWVCLSFLSPESLIESKEEFFVSKFLQSYSKEKGLDEKKVLDSYNDFKYKFQSELQKDYDKKVNFKNNIRGLKVRGTYSTREEAESRAEKLHKLDKDFHVFIGQVGYWLPWDPCPDNIEEEKFLDKELNDMMKKYKENQLNKDEFFEEQKREKLKNIKEENEKKENKQSVLEKTFNEEDTWMENKLKEPEPEIVTEDDVID